MTPNFEAEYAVRFVALCRKERRAPRNIRAKMGHRKAVTADDVLHTIMERPFIGSAELARLHNCAMAVMRDRLAELRARKIGLQCKRPGPFDAGQFWVQP
jgi:hypothetical protein